jgi:hypothetical protein
MWRGVWGGLRTFSQQPSPFFSRDLACCADWLAQHHDLDVLDWLAQDDHFLYVPSVFSSYRVIGG